MDQRHRNMIAREFRDCMMNTVKRLDNAETNRPFHAALLSDEALFWSKFERSFSTSFGQRVVEEISKVVVLAGGASDATRQMHTNINIDSAIDAAITEHMNLLRKGGGVKNWKETLDSINRTPRSGELVNHRIISDLWWFKCGISHYMSIKTVKPNIDQTVVAKQDLLRLTFANPSCKVYFGLYYNPYGEFRTSYAHTPPMGIFNFHSDEVVLLGKDYWDTLGGTSCYETVLQIAREVGIETRSMLNHLRKQ